MFGFNIFLLFYRSRNDITLARQSGHSQDAEEPDTRSPEYMRAFERFIRHTNIVYDTFFYSQCAIVNYFIYFFR